MPFQLLAVTTVFLAPIMPFATPSPNITSPKMTPRIGPGTTMTAKKPVAIAVLISCSVLGFSLVAPVVAEEDSEKVKFVMSVLDSANAEVQARMLELQDRGIDIPLAAKAYHDHALAEYSDAKDSLVLGYPEMAKIRAMTAMELFKKASDELGSLDQSQDQTAAVIEVEEKIAKLHHKADYLKTLAKENPESRGFSDYAAVINSARNSLKDGSIEDAEKQLAQAESILAGIKSDMQYAADINKDKRTMEFAQKLVSRLSDMVDKAQEDQSTNSSSPLIKFIEQLKNATDVDAIMNMTDDLSELESMIREYQAGSSADTSEQEKEGTSSDNVDGSHEESKDEKGDGEKDDEKDDGEKDDDDDDDEDDD
jgi:hypothetical protein